MSSEQENILDTPQDHNAIPENPPEDEIMEADPKDEQVEEKIEELEPDKSDNTEIEINNDQVTAKPNRELKSILELSKEAKLDTNIGHKRKSVEPGGKQENVTSGSNSDKRVMKIQNIDLQGKLSDIEATGSISDNEDNKETKEKDGSNNSKMSKRKRDSLHESSIGGAVDEHGKRSRKLSNNLIITMNNKKKDPFCWRCHHEGPAVFCETCPRSFHQKCLKQNVSQSTHWICPECLTILKAENLKQRSPAMRDMSLEHLCGLLKFALKRMLQVGGCEPFINPVSENEFPEYKNYIVQPMDLTCLEKNIKDNIYGSTQAFEADAQWILHNSIIFNSYQSKLTSIAKSIMKICKQEMSEIENCASCYLNANTKKKTWFVEVCPKPHLLVWAKLKGFPYWPAKAMRTNSQGFVDVRFFGAHDRAWVPYKECFLYSLRDPNSSKLKRNDIIESVKELNIHIENLKEVYIEFHYAEYREMFEPTEELQQLQCMLPRYDPEARTVIKRSMSRNNLNGTTSSDSDSDESNSDSDTERKSTNMRKKQKTSEADDEEIKRNEDQDTNEQSEEINNLNKNDSDTSKSSENNESFCCAMLGDSSSFNPARGGKVRMRGGYTNTSGKLKVIPKLVSPENENKRPSCDEFEFTSKKISRRNSDQSVKSDSSRLSNISDKINKVDISENVEISLINDTNRSSLNISENTSPSNELSKLDLPEIALESKRKPIVQLNITANENAEFTISPQSKSRIADRLMKKLTEPVDENKIETVKKQISDPSEKCILNVNQNITETDLLLEKFKSKSLTVLENITELSPDIEIFETNTEETNQDEKEDINKSVEDLKENKIENGEDSLEVTSSEDEESLESSDVSSKKDCEPSSNSNGNKLNEEKNEKDSVQVVTSSSEKGTVAEQNSHTENLDTKIKDKTTTKEVDNSDKTVITNKKSTESTANNNEKAVLVEKSQPKPTQTIQQPLVMVESNKRKRNDDKNDADIEEINPLQKKLVKVVNIDDIKNKILDNNTENTSDNPILASRLSTAKIVDVFTQNTDKEDSLEHAGISVNDLNTSVVIKSEPSSDDEPSDNEYMELKRKYLSALNLNESEKMPEKPKQNEMRTRSKSDDKRFKVVDNLSKVIDDVASHYSAVHANEEIKLRSSTTPTAPKRKEIFIKPLSKMQMPKQRARKSFPMPITIKNVYPAMKKDTSKVSKSITTPIITAVPLRNVVTTKAPETTSTNASNIMFLSSTPAMTNTITILPPNQPITYSSNVGNPMLTMVQHPPSLTNVYLQPISASTSTTNSTVSQTQPTDSIESQNYIPQSGAPSKTLTSTTTISAGADNVTPSTSIPSLAPLSAPTTTTSSINISNPEPLVRPNDLLDELQTLTSFVPETLTKSISEIMCRVPPKLKPRPPGPLTAQFDEGLPSAAGTVTTRVNSISHRLGDYFRGMLVELLQDMGASSNPEAEITKLKLENEELKHKHGEEILEIKKNISSILKDIQKSLADERTRLIDETRSLCEVECLKRVEEAKSKQWCANCSKEAQFYCCWNTSYCDYPCQQKHWPKHMSKCTQNIQNAQQLQTTNVNTAGKSQSQPIVLRPTVAPKGFTKTLIAKPTKVFVNRSGNNKNAFNVMRTSSGNHITLVEATPGNYELVGNGGPISIGGKFITSMGKIKTGNVISVTSPSSSGSTIVTGSGQKTVVLTQAKSVAPPPKPPTTTTTTTTIVSDEEGE